MRQLKIISIAAVIIFLVTASAFCATTGKIAAQSGKSFNIILKSNASTGYKWQLAEPIDKNLLELTGSKYVYPGKDLVGAPGEEIWEFKALKSGKADIHFKYVRDWEKNTPPADKKDFVVEIK
jgi:predicted secreted protein